MWMSFHVVNCMMTKVRGWFCFLCMELDHENLRLYVSFVLLQYSAFVADSHRQFMGQECLDSVKNKKKMLLRESSSGNGLQPSFPDL